MWSNSQRNSTQPWSHIYCRLEIFSKFSWKNVFCNIKLFPASSLRTATEPLPLQTTTSCHIQSVHTLDRQCARLQSTLWFNCRIFQWSSPMCQETPKFIEHLCTPQHRAHSINCAGFSHTVIYNSDPVTPSSLHCLVLSQPGCKSLEDKALTPCVPRSLFRKPTLLELMRSRSTNKVWMLNDCAEICWTCWNWVVKDKRNKTPAQSNKR